MPNRKDVLEFEKAEAIALTGLAFLAEYGERLGHFLALTGVGPERLRSAVGEPRLLAAVLGHLLEDESLLLVFAGMKGIDPALIGPAYVLLCGHSPNGVA